MGKDLLQCKRYSTHFHEVTYDALGKSMVSSEPFRLLADGGAPSHSERGLAPCPHCKEEWTLESLAGIVDLGLHQAQRVVGISSFYFHGETKRGSDAYKFTLFGPGGSPLLFSLVLKNEKK